MKSDKYLIELRELMKSRVSLPRYEHVLRVEQTAVEIASHHNIDNYKVAISAILHDYAKELSENEREEIARHNDIDPDHAYVGAFLVREELGITDKEILQGIECHSHGMPILSNVAKCVYLADRLEPSRKYENPEKMEFISQLAKTDIDKAVYEQCKESFKFNMKCGKIHKNTMAMYTANKDNYGSFMEGLLNII